MKKLISLLGAVSLTATGASSVVACKKPKIITKKEETIYELHKPPSTSNWKLIDNPKNEIQKNYDENKSYFLVLGNILNEYNIQTNVKVFKDDFMWGLYKYEALYRWDGTGKSQTPTIDRNTGKITDWKE